MKPQRGPTLLILDDSTRLEALAHRFSRSMPVQRARNIGALHRLQASQVEVLGIVLRADLLGPDPCAEIERVTFNVGGASTLVLLSSPDAPVINAAMASRALVAIEPTSDDAILDFYRNAQFAWTAENERVAAALQRLKLGVALARREEEVFRRLPHSFTAKDLANDLGVKETTVRGYLDKLRAKFGVQTIEELRRRVIRVIVPHVRPTRL